MELYKVEVHAEYFVIINGGEDEDWDLDLIGVYEVLAEDEEEAKERAIELAIPDDPHHGSEYRYVAFIVNMNKSFNDMVKSRRYGLKKTSTFMVESFDTDVVGLKEMLAEKLYSFPEDRTMSILESIRFLESEYIHVDDGVFVEAISRMIDTGMPLTSNDMMLAPDGQYYPNDFILENDKDEFDLVYDTSESTLRDLCERGGYQPAEPDVGINTGYTEYNLLDVTLGDFECMGLNETFNGIFKWWVSGDKGFRFNDEIDWDDVGEKVFELLNESDYESERDYFDE